MKILLTGGTGFIGRAAARYLAGRGEAVTVVSRSGKSGNEHHPHVTPVKGDPVLPGDWQEAVHGSDAVINLAGASIFRRWTPKARREIHDSRILTTRNVVDALAGGSTRVLLSASAVGYYGDGGERELGESGGPGRDFLADLSVQWEAEAARAEGLGVRVCRMRFGVVLAGDGGALGKMMPGFKSGLAGRLGHGRQWFPWIHRQDLIRIIEFLMERQDASGAFNLTAPAPVTNADFTKALARALRRPAILPAPAWAVRLALGDLGAVFLEGQKAVPRRLTGLGFEFNFPTLNLALADILGSG